MDPPVSLGYHSRDVTAGIDPAGDPGGDRTSRCEIHLPLPASSSSPRGCDAGGFGEAGSPLACGSCGCPPAASQPGSQSLCATSVLPCETRHREQKKAGMLAWKLTRFRVSFQMERQISSIRTPRTLPAAAPAHSQTSDPCPALHITPEALEGQSRHHKAGDVSGAAAFGVFFPPSLEIRDLLGSGCAAPEHPPGMNRAGLGRWVELKGNAQELLRWDGRKPEHPRKGENTDSPEKGRSRGSKPSPPIWKPGQSPLPAERDARGQQR